VGLHFEVFWTVWPSLARGTLNSLLLIVTVFFASTLCGAVVALGRRTKFGWLRQILAAASWVARGTPPLMLLLLVFLLPPELGIVPSPFVAATVGMTLYISFYFAEAFDGGFASIPREQYQGVAALALPRFRAFRRIILPQILPAILPSYFSRATEIVKGTAIAAVVGFPELATAAKQSLTYTFRPIEVLALAACVYIVMNGVLMWLQAVFEQASRARRR
jgi:His/Glu/Gln/Arg/opine family amino acid ABC transporter permease subunit